jgi:hypothetical protein
MTDTQKKTYIIVKLIHSSLRLESKIYKGGDLSLINTPLIDIVQLL